MSERMKKGLIKELVNDANPLGEAARRGARLIRLKALEAEVSHCQLVISFALLLAYGSPAFASDFHLLNYADPTVHPYADPAGGRDQHRYTDAQVNELRLYDFYSRQADYYLEKGKVPEIIPAYPGMDAGLNSHWGTHPQVHIHDNAWSHMDNGSAIGSVMAQGEDFMVKAVHLRLGGNARLSATFDPLSLSYRLVWGEAFLRYPSRRWGITGLVEPGGKIILENPASGWSAITGDKIDSVTAENHYHGYYRHGDEIIFKYRLHSAEILDRPGALSIAGTSVFTRTLQLTNGSPGLQLSTFLLPEEATMLEPILPNGMAGVAYNTDAGIMGLLVQASDGIDGIKIREGEAGALVIEIPMRQAGSTLTLYSWNADLEAEVAASAIRKYRPGIPPELLDGGPSRWTEVITRIPHYRANATAPQSSTARRNVGTGADSAGSATLQGVDQKGSNLESIDSASFVKIPRNDPDVGTRPSTARYEFRETSGLTLKGERGSGNGPYLIDTIPVPFENPYGSPMFLTGLDFFPNGDAAVSTFFGDVWIVRGLDRDLKSVRWKRIAQGLNQPLGLLVIDGKIQTLGKDQITVLHDLNGDEEIDFYENFCNSYVTSPGSHDYNTGFQRDDAGFLYFATKHAGVVRVSPDGKRVDSLGAGLRNPNGIGVSPDGRVWCSPQEGQWTPASQIVRIQPDGYYGFQKHIDEREITPATAYIPRGIDNSTGGSVYITSDRWGPMKDKLVVFSYGASSHYLYLEDKQGSTLQGGIVPLEGDFLSGVHRARVNPLDGQVYAVGSQGWMDYAIQDGSFERVRYTGKPVYYPSGFQVFQNGIRVDFYETLSNREVEDHGRQFAQQWQYLYSMGYGSPEFSIRESATVGHDPLHISSATVVNAGRSLFLEIPDLVPAMTVHLRLHLKFADGNPFATDLFATIHQLGVPFLGISNPEPLVVGKPQSLHLPIRPAPPPREVEPGDDEPGRQILLKAITGLKYDQEKIVVRAGERISLTLVNTDEMPHNWILTGWFTYELVGQLADAMVADPTAAERHYVPDDQSVLQYTRVLNPGESQTIHFNAPTAPGDYPYLCTFPGHWQTMKGTLLVY